jgi:hypothetical protein
MMKRDGTSVRFDNTWKECLRFFYGRLERIYMNVSSNYDARTKLPTYEKSVTPWMFLWGWLFFVAFKWYWLGSRVVYVFAV